MGENIYLVYEHWRPDKDVCFYVGKGKGKRPYDMKMRSRWHKSVVSKLLSLGHCVDVRIIVRNISEFEAFSKERELISHYGRGNLINMTDGGDGTSGWNPSEETRAKMRAAARIRNENPEYRKKLSAAISLAWTREGYREAMGEKISAAQKGSKRAPLSEATKQKISEGNKGKIHRPTSAETKEKISKANKGKIISIQTREKISTSNLGKKRTLQQIANLKAAKRPLSIEARAKMGAASRGNSYRLGKTHTSETKDMLRRLGLDRREVFEKYRILGPKAASRPVFCVDDRKLFDSASAAARFYEVNKSAVIELCLGLRGRKSVGGRVFRYVEAA